MKSYNEAVTRSNFKITIQTRLVLVALFIVISLY